MSDVPMPGECHPAYADMTWLKDWVERRDDQSARMIPIVPRLRAMATSDEPLTAAMPVITMTRKKCAGPAPYVGRRFAYVWYVGEDELGRCVAGETRIQYDPDDFYYQ